MNHLNFDKFHEINDKLFHKGVNQELDDVIKRKLENNDKLISILKFFETLFIKKEKNPSDYIKIHKTANGDISLQLTKLRGKKCLNC